MEETIVIKNESIPIIIKSYRTSKSVKIFFKNDRITITKPTRISKKSLSEIIKKNLDFIYTTYQKGIQNKEKKQWETGETIYYKGEKFTIVRERKEGSKVHIHIKEDKKQMIVIVPHQIEETQIKEKVDKKVRSLFKDNTNSIIQERLSYLSKITGIEYAKFTVREAVTRYGSCVSKTKQLRFSSRLIMLPSHVIDAIIIHELCHIIHANHSKDFYSLVKRYIPNYATIDKWLRKNGKVINY